MQVRAYRTVDGSPIEGSNVVPFSAARWTHTINEPGSMELSLPKSRPLAAWNARRKLRPWFSSVALIHEGEVIHHGPVLRRKWSLRGGLQVTVGGAWDLFAKRLVLNHALDAKWRDGEIVLDEDNPRPEWVLSLRGMSLPGIGAALVREALKWGPLLVDTPGTPQAGVNERTYNGWDFATTADRLTELTEVLNGPRISFEGYLRPADGHLRSRYVGSVASGRRHKLSTAMEGHGLIVEDVDEDGGSLATEAYALGGRDEDIVLAARTKSALLTAQGYPVMQEALKSHASVSRLTTLQGHTNQRIVDGSIVPESTQLKVRRSRGVQPGDVIEATMESSYHGSIRDMVLHVVEVAGDTGDWVTVSAFPEVV